jgi:hypothetical protein
VLENVRTFTTRQIASDFVFAFVTTSICPTPTVVDIRSTAPCGNTIIVDVCSSNGSLFGSACPGTCVMREP